VLAIALAIAAASSWGLSAVLVRRGLRDLSTSAGTLLSLASGLLFTAVLVAALQLDELLAVSWRAVVLFGLIGVLNFPMGRFFNYMAIGRLGVGRSTPLLASSPLFAVLIAVLFTGEQLTLATGAGIALILGGVFVTITAPRGER
jgi:drug/metabolite transporter (DMT)-like permease